MSKSVEYMEAWRQRELRRTHDPALRLELPFPPKELSPNDRSGWRKKATVVAQYREDCAWTGIAKVRGAIPARMRGSDRSPPTLTPPVEATVTFVVPDRRKRDLDNLLAMLKPAWDGLMDAGVLAGDDTSQFKVADATIEVDREPVGCVGWWRPEPKVIVSLSGAGTTQ